MTVQDRFLPLIFLRQGSAFGPPETLDSSSDYSITMLEFSCGGQFF